MKKKVIKTVRNLINTFGSITTLDVKNFCRSSWPDITFNQQDVSDIMADLDYPFTDNGKFRTYEKKIKITKINKSQLVAGLVSAGKEKFTVTWTTQKGNLRTYEGTLKNPSTPVNTTGYVLIETSDGTKSVDTRTLESFIIYGKKYIS